MIARVNIQCTPFKYVSALLLLAAIFAAPARGQLSTAYSIDEVQVQGNRRVDTAAIKQQLKKTSGEISDEAISEDIKTLYRTGFFDQVSASIERGAKTVLLYTVVEKPIVRKVYIRGNEEVKESDLVDVFTFGARRFLDKAKLESLARAGVIYYQSRGYYDAVVTSSVVPVDNNQVDVTFDVKEGDRYKIIDISFQGAKEIDTDDLKTVIETKRYKWWSSWLLGTGRLNREMLENDKNIIRQYFLDHGFIDGTVSDPTIEKDDGGLTITFDINEGPQYKVGQISASGDLINGSSTDTMEGIELKEGEVFSASKIRADSFIVSDKFGDQGYAFANVVPNTSVDRDSQRVNIDYSISKGKKVKVDKIQIKGNQKTYDNVIRRELRIGEQDTYSTSKVKRSETLLKRLGYFDEANIATSPTEEDDKVNLDVSVREASTGTFTAGAGYSSSDGAIFNSRISENNIMGTGRRVDLNLELGTQRDNIALSYLDPRFRDSYLSLGTDIERTNREFTDFDRRLTGGGVTLGYPLEEVFGSTFEDVAASLRYEYLSIDINDIDKTSAAPLVIESEGNSTASAITPQLTRNTIDNPLNPTKGSRQVASVELAGAGGNQQYYLLEARNQFYRPMFDPGFGPFIFSWRIRAAYGDTFDDERFPLFRRFFPGGINSVRGFRNRSLGPKDEEGNEFGGSKELINNLETIFPLVNSAGLKGVVFYDAGEAFDDDETINIGDLRTAYGFGIRWASPLGPIRIEFGFPIDRQEGERGTVTMFSFGAPL